MDNYRTPLLMEPQLFGGGTANIMRTPLGNVRTTQGPPPLPPPVQFNNDQHNNYGSFLNGMGQMGGYGGGYSSSLYSGLGYGGNYGYGGYGGANFGGYSGGFNRFGSSYSNHHDPESRFIQLAEENSRPAFESIESLVSAVANIASMLDSTFFAITSSFRAILGVAANFGRLRGVFSQFWQTFAIFRGLTWLYKKLLYWLRLSNIDPSTAVFKEAFAAAQNATLPANADGTIPIQSKKQSPWPVIVFLSFIFTAPYLVMKLLGNLTSSAFNETKDPRRWINPITSKVIYDFQARNQSELNLKAGQTIFIAPKEIQNTQKLLKTGWALATLDGIHSGIIPIGYVERLDKLNTNIVTSSSTPSSTTTVTPTTNIPNTELNVNESTGKLFPELLKNDVDSLKTYPIENINNVIQSNNPSEIGSANQSEHDNF